MFQRDDAPIMRWTMNAPSSPMAPRSRYCTVRVSLYSESRSKLICRDCWILSRYASSVSIRCTSSLCSATASW